MSTATHLAITQAPSEVIANTPFNVTVEYVDDAGNLDPNQQGTIGFEGRTVDGQIYSLTGIGDGYFTPVNGVVEITGVEGAVTGQCTLKANDLQQYSGRAYILPADPHPVTFIAGPAASLSFHSNPKQVFAGDYGGAPIMVDDAYGNPVQTQVKVSLVSTDGHTNTATSVDGLIDTGVLVTAAEPQTITVTADGLPSITSAPFDVYPGTPVRTTLTGLSAGNTIAAGQSLAGVYAETFDAYDNPTNDFGKPIQTVMTVSFFPLPSSPSTSVKANPVKGDGVDLSLLVAPTQAGSYQLDFDTDSDRTSYDTPFQSSAVTVMAGPAVKVAVVPPDVGVPEPIDSFHIGANEPLEHLPLAVEDVYGNAAADGTTIAITSDGPLTGTTSLPTAGGYATFSDLEFTTTGQYTLMATDGSLAPVRLPVSIGATILQRSTTLAGKSVGMLKINASDYFPMLVAQKTGRKVINLDLISEPASLSQELVAHLHPQNGMASIGVPPLHNAGLYKITATGTYGDPGFTVEFTVLPAAPSHVSVFVSQTAQAPVPMLTVNVSVQDRYRNRISTLAGTVVTLKYVGPAVNKAKPTLGGVTSRVLDANGAIDFTGLTLPPLPRGKIVATVTGLPPGVSNTFTIRS